MWDGVRRKAVACAFALLVSGATLAPTAFAQEATPVVEAVVAPPVQGAEGSAVAVVAATAQVSAPEVVVAPPAPAANKADTTWMMISTVLVLIMIVPGLALFYGGLVRTKNMLSVLMQVSTVTVIGMMLWAFVGYSLTFTDGGPLNSWIGGASRFFLLDNGTDLSDNLAATFSTGVYIPEIVFVCFQMTFACITAALVLGGLAERVKFIGIVLFSIVWPLLVYYPIAHMVWFWPGPDAVANDPDNISAGFVWAKGALDFAGGTVVHINAGIAALMGAIVLGPRHGYDRKPIPPHSLTMTLIGTGLLWFGWFGFNAGSNLEANYYAGLAMANTFLATAAAGFSWMLTEWLTKGKPSLLGMCSGIVAGLVAVTPAAGFAGPVGAIALGLLVSPVCIFFVSFVKSLLGYDDTLDVFGIHCVGGIVGALATGVLVNPALGGAGIVDYTTCLTDGDISTCDALPYDLVTQMTAQGTGVLVTLLWSGAISLVIFGLLRITGLLRAPKEHEEEGLDLPGHGEVAYNM
ncbi:MAG: ammonium transporter [Terricaulis sp.]